VADLTLHSWEEPNPAAVIEVHTDGDWAALENATILPNANPLPWQRCLEVAKACGAQTVVVETRYVDLDYRSEYSAFFSRTFAEIPDTARRYHFFRDRLAADSIWNLDGDGGYLGYVVARPTGLGFTGRTMLTPPPDVAPHVTCLTSETINFFGQELSVSAVPFVQQDTQFGRCAHAAAWMCHYTAVRTGRAPRRPIADFGLLADHSVVSGRPVPSAGLTGLQISNLMSQFGLPPIFYAMDSLPDHPRLSMADPGTRAVPVLCRYLNSGMPVLVGTGSHAFIVVGYERVRRRGGTDWFRFVRHDDQAGPYRWIEDINNDIDATTGHDYGPWRMLIAPLPTKLWLSPEAAERKGISYLAAFDGIVASDGIQRARDLNTLMTAGRLSHRTYAIESNAFKIKAGIRRLGADATRELRLARMSRLVWVVEAIDRRRRRAGGPCVMGEVVFDATSSDISPQPLTMRVPGALIIFGTDGSYRYPIDSTDRAVRSACDVEH